MTNISATNSVLRRFDPAVLTAFGCIIALLLIGSIANENFQSPDYLLQQLQVGSFLPLVSTGLMIVILLALAFGGTTGAKAARATPSWPCQVPP